LSKNLVQLTKSTKLLALEKPGGKEKAIEDYKDFLQKEVKNGKWTT
jgi:hypothetical protein